MGVKIYRKSDLKIVSSVPDGVDPIRDFELNVGGNIADYSFIDIPFAYFSLERQDGGVVAVKLDPPAIEPEPKSPSEIEQLKHRLDEMDAALFDVIIKTSMTI